ncbi:hypothetical protein QS306_09165 [Paraburkholderia bonniea]|uniref:hypothetical protein n=1 Tax=Paraburkholderia bonniea TaxID=2152891 RepID=UPI00129184A2|nr:hypothetical protein [Paraburkholderia bonniea]WJF89292.1 hypothetical protein QS306_09165 [Paraburkholderia bonniea]WJF92608.1 hypothetical protein QS308_09175 [Paraburkholderia bonniea]
MTTAATTLTETPEHAFDLLKRRLAAYAAGMPLPRETLDRIEYLAHMVLSQSRYREAIDLYRLLVMHAPTTLGWRYGLARALQLHEQHEDALQQYQFALALGGNSSTYGLRMAECQLALGQRPLALRTIRQALAEHDPASGSPAALTRLQQLHSVLSALETHHEETRVQPGE